MLKNLRIKFGHSAVAPYVKRAMVERKQVFESLFSHETVTFTDSIGTPIQGELVYCHDLVDFIHTLAMLREQQISDLVLKFGMDNGNSIITSFKV